MFFARHVEILLVGDYEEGCLELPPDSACPLASEKESLNVVLSACRGLERLALWLPERNSTLLPEFLGSQGCIRPTHRSVFDITATVPRLDCWPLSLTHLNLDEADIDANASIPWREIFTGCPRLTHLCLSGAAISHLLSHGRLLAWIKEPLARLPSTLETLVILLNADCLSLARNEHGITRLRSMMDPLIQASDRLVVITRAMDDSYKVVDGVHRFPQDHSVESDWGDGRSVMDTWEFADLCIAERKRERLGKLDISVQGLISERLL